MTTIRRWVWFLRTAWVMSMRLRVPFDAADHVLGAARAPVTLVLYGDYEDPWCLRVQRIIDAAFSALKGQLRLVFRHFPMTRVHPHAQRAAEVAEAAGDRGRFWQMHDFLFKHQDRLGDADLVRHAAAVGLDAEWVLTTLQVHMYAPHVQQDFLGGVQSGVAAAPTFFINESRYDGPLDVGSLVLALQGAEYDARRAALLRDRVELRRTERRHQQRTRLPDRRARNLP